MSKDCTAEDNITFCDTFGLKPSSSFMVSLARGWSSALLNKEHNDFSQSSRKDDFCLKWHVNYKENGQLQRNWSIEHLTNSTPSVFRAKTLTNKIQVV
jgi:hypothetical protein